jgi:hypothetical protein
MPAYLPHSDINGWCLPLHSWKQCSFGSRQTVNAVMVRRSLVTVHSHALAVPAELAVRRWRNGARVPANSRALLERKQLLGTERLVVDLSSGFDEVLQVGAGQEVAEVYKLAVVLILDCGC